MRIPLIGIDRIARQRLHGHRRDELRRALGHHHLYVRTKLAQRAAQICDLVTSDTAC